MPAAFAAPKISLLLLRPSWPLARLPLRRDNLGKRRNVWQARRSYISGTVTVATPSRHSSATPSAGHQIWGSVRQQSLIVSQKPAAGGKIAAGRDDQLLDPSSQRRPGRRAGVGLDFLQDRHKRIQSNRGVNPRNCSQNFPAGTNEFQSSFHANSFPLVKTLPIRIRPSRTRNEGRISSALSTIIHSLPAPASSGINPIPPGETCCTQNAEFSKTDALAVNQVPRASNRHLISGVWRQSSGTGAVHVGQG